MPIQSATARGEALTGIPLDVYPRPPDAARQLFESERPVRI